MKQGFLMLFVLLILSACSHPKKKEPTIIAVNKDSSKALPAQDNIVPDSSFTLFDDPAYKLQLHIFDKGALDQTKANAILTVKFNQDNGEKVVLKDSIYCMQPYIGFKDFNNDNVKDLVIYYYGNSRANERYHLYLVYPASHKLVHVKGFEEIPNPDLDTKNNIITSLSLSGADYYSFYRINQKNGLVNLGHAFETATDDSTKYKAAIKGIQQEDKTE